MHIGLRLVPIAAAIGASLALLLGCVDRGRNVTPTIANPELTKAALALEKPPAGRARVLFFNGGNTAGDYRPRNFSVDIFVNASKIGTLNTHEAMVFDLAPGRYSFHWSPHGGKGLINKIEPTEYTVQSGELVPLRADSDNYTFKVNRGFKAQQLSNSEGRQQIEPNIEIVRPSSCPPNICID